MFEGDHEVGIAGGLQNGCAISGCGTYLSGIGILLKPERFFSLWFGLVVWGVCWFGLLGSPKMKGIVRGINHQLAIS